MDAMVLDRATCRRARLSRDARFDGRFFVGVRTTGVFCRPICPAVPPSERNVAYFATAAAAAEAGFRACLRCRPECAPGTPAWAGASTTVTRALRLIAEGALDAEEGVEALAARLGVGGRHLRRLFVAHLGASPVAVLQTRRLLAAKRLIDETDIALTTVASAAGFNSIRRFNAAFRSSYGRSPRQLRAASRHASARGRGATAGAAAYSFDLRYRPPFHWEALLRFLADRALPGVEGVEGQAYSRSIVVGSTPGWIRIARAEAESVRLDIHFPEASHLLLIASKARRMCDLDADPAAVQQHLEHDELLGPLVRQHPGLRVPGAWDGFELAVRAVLGQQVSVKAARTLAGRLVERFGEPLPAAGEEGRPPALTHTFPSPAALAEGDVASIGLPAARADSIRRLAHAVAWGDVSLDGLMDPAVVRERLRELPGFGEWTVEYVALRALGDPDAFPASDLGLLRASGARTSRELRDRAEAWRPWRAYAVLHLWMGSS